MDRTSEESMVRLDAWLESTFSRIVTRWLFPVVLGLLGSFMWEDVRDTLIRVQLIQFQQIKDGKDIERHADDIKKLKDDVDTLKMEQRGKKMRFDSESTPEAKVKMLLP